MQELNFNYLLLYCFCCILFSYALPQQPEINDQFENKTKTELDGHFENTASVLSTVPAEREATPKLEDNEVSPKKVTKEPRRKVHDADENLSIGKRICHMIASPFIKIIRLPKVNSVLRNIGTCIVNGAMELITFYFPAPLIPLIATAAGMIIPFEPVVMLREKMSVTSYRRAFRTALNGFLSTFDRYKLDDEDDDPYMTRRFNRRIMNDSGEKKY